MSAKLSRRQLLGLPLGLLALPRLAIASSPVRKTFSYQANMGVLFDLLTFHVTGTVVEEIDHAAGRYRVVLTGEGSSVTHRTESLGMIRNGRFLPTASWSTGTIRGRENRHSTRYDYERGTIEYHSLGHTLILGRVRQVNDVLKLPTGQPVDDLASATLNFAEGQLEADAEGYYRTVVVRRAKAENEGPDDVSPSGYRAELVPLRFRAKPDPRTGRLVATIDITRFSSWARANQPAEVTFDEARHIESVKSSLMLGSSVNVRLTSSI
ncbi:MAG TPA: hypothetical protein VJU61_00460 [Polyangiaceae bacterium]|nr:hypothetical protein [Polyangiaceae bacterium]